MPDLIQIVFLGVACLLALAAAALAYRSLRRCFTWGSAYGSVQRLDEVPGRRGQPMFRPVVRFTTRDGRELSFASEMASSYPGYRVGATVRVLYNPLDAESAEIASFVRLWLLPVVLLVFAGVFFYVSRQS